ncbi:MAG: nitrous oxide reductase accessory protein NosL [Syntrophobacter sp.]
MKSEFLDSVEGIAPCPLQAGPSNAFDLILEGIPAYGQKFIFLAERKSVKRISMFLMVMTITFAFVPIVPAANDISAHKACKACGMDREQFSSSRVLLEYPDGSQAGLCSIHCAAKEMAGAKKSPGVIRVADYNTRELIDAKTASWVLGGKIQGVMTTRAKWAFGTRAAAEAFIERNGGELASFDTAMKAASDELDTDAANTRGGRRGSAEKQPGEGHACHEQPGAQFYYNPAFGDDIYHNHPAGMWMVNYKFMHMDMGGLRRGTTDVPVSSVGPNKQNPYMMIPSDMTMDMQMAMVMYGITDRLTVMGMASYLASEMGMLMDMGMGARPDSPMDTSGFGDTDIRGIFKINGFLNGSLGLTIPTGSIEKSVSMMGMQFRAPYDMQLGGGTFNLKPALTYSQLSCDALWNWGAQAMYTWHVSKNDNDWAYGDTLKLTWWLQRAFGPVNGWLRMAYSDTGEIRGRDPEIQKLQSMASGAPTPDADPYNYGGQRIDFLFGTSFAKGPFSFGIEGGIPVYENVNGLQMKTNWLLTVGAQVMF